MIYANCGAIAVITSMTYMTIFELLMRTLPPFPEVIRPLIMTPTSSYIEIISMETERSTKACG